MIATRSGERAIRGLLAQAIVLLASMYHLAVGAALLGAPAWFYETIGPFPPFNRHYLGDLGSAFFALGIGLLFAARAPRRQSGIVGVAAVAGLLHAANHAYDALIAGAPLAEWLAEPLPLALIAALLALAYVELRRAG